MPRHLLRVLSAGLSLLVISQFIGPSGSSEVAAGASSSVEAPSVWSDWPLPPSLAERADWVDLTAVWQRWLDSGQRLPVSVTLRVPQVDTATLDDAQWAEWLDTLSDSAQALLDELPGAEPSGPRTADSPHIGLSVDAAGLDRLLTSSRVAALAFGDHPDMTRLALGGGHGLYLQGDGRLWAWGANDRGQLGDGTVIDRSSPVSVLSGVTAVAAGDAYSLALKSDGSLWAWGANDQGQLGDGTDIDRSSPVRVLSHVTAIAAGARHALILDRQGQLWAWGGNAQGQLGDGTTEDRFSPVGVLTDVVAVAGGGAHSLALGVDGRLWAWGANDRGQLGDGTTLDRSAPAFVMSDVVALSAGGFHSLAVTSDRRLWAWGANDRGQLGNGSPQDETAPSFVLSDVIAVAAGANHSLALTADDQLWTWGTNARGQIGDGTTQVRTTPVHVQVDIAAMAGGTAYTLALTVDGRLWAWGANRKGPLGVNRDDFVDVPTQSFWEQPAISSELAAKNLDAMEGGCPVYINDYMIWNCITPSAYESLVRIYKDLPSRERVCLEGVNGLTCERKQIMSDAGFEYYPYVTEIRLWFQSGLRSLSVSSLSSFPDLKLFSINGYFTAPSYLPNLDGLTQLEEFIVSPPDYRYQGSGVTGSIPSLDGLTNLKTVDLSDNQLTGSIPNLSGLTNLQAFIVDYNRLAGSIPSLSTLSNLSGFNASHNQLTGSIPSLDGLNNLKGFLASYNAITGEIPNISGLPNLEYFEVGFNKLTGPIPDFSDLPNLFVFDASFNQITGQLPRFSGLNKLGHLFLDHNEIHGSIEGLEALSNLAYVRLEDNRLTGPFPDLRDWKSSDLKNLGEFYVSNNKLSGPMPPPPTELPPGSIRVCNNYLESTGSAEDDAAWDVLTGLTPVDGVPGWLDCQNRLFRNPLVLYLSNPVLPFLAPGGLIEMDPREIFLNAPTAQSMSADGASAVVVTFPSSSADPVTFTVEGSGAGLTTFNGNYLSDTSLWRKSDSLPKTLTVSPLFQEGSRHIFMALLWPPNQLPSTAGSELRETLSVNVRQANSSLNTTETIDVIPPPLLLVHGIWSSADAAGFTRGSGGFADWISSQYPKESLIGAVNYDIFNDQAFSSKGIQNLFVFNAKDLLYKASNSKIMARTIDVVAHSMGGLVTRYFMMQLQQNGTLKGLPDSLINQLITVGTPHHGSFFANFLLSFSNEITYDPLLLSICVKWDGKKPCTLKNFMSAMGQSIDAGGVESLQNPQIILRESQKYDAIIGLFEGWSSPTRSLLNIATKSFSGLSIDQILNTTQHDLIVAASSQGAGANQSATITGIVHSTFDNPVDWDIPVVDITDTGETKSQKVWSQAFTWLTGKKSLTAEAFSEINEELAPSFDLSDYTEVSSSTSLQFTPPNNSTLTIGQTVDIIPTVSEKTITEIWLFQITPDPAEHFLYYSTQSPFSISYKPIRLGTTDFVVFVLFNDKTYSANTLTYTLQPQGAALSLTLDAPEVSLWTQLELPIPVNAMFADGSIVDVSSAAIYKSRSGTDSVFSVSAQGVITTTGSGTDWLDVDYDGLTASAEITVLDSGISADRTDMDWRITEIYIATMAYAPDNEGLQYWVEQINTNPAWNPTSVAQSFFDQPLVQAQYPAELGEEALIDALYQNIFGRAPDATGKDYWLSELQAGHVQRNEMIIALIEGGWANPDAAEDMARFGHRVEVGLAFAAEQEARGIRYSTLSNEKQSKLRQIGAELVNGVTSDSTTRDAAISSIPALLNGL